VYLFELVFFLRASFVFYDLHFIIMYPLSLFFSLIFCLFVLLAVGVVLCNPTSPLRLSLSLVLAHQFRYSVNVFSLSHPVTSINNQGVAILAPAYVDDSISNINIIIKYVDWVA
jgi:hypothetical protein